MIGEQRARVRLAAVLAVLAAFVGGTGCGGGSKDIHATFRYPMAGCFPLAPCSTRPEVTGLDGHAPTFRVAEGSSLPAWASLDPATGEVSGVPLGPATPAVIIDLTVDGVAGKLSAGISLTVDPLVFRLCYDTADFSDEVGVTLQPIHACIGGNGYGKPLAVGVTTAFSLTSGALPPGVTLDAATGLVAGVPTVAGRFDFEVTVHLEYQLTSFTLVDAGAIVVAPRRPPSATRPTRIRTTPSSWESGRR